MFKIFAMALFQVECLVMSSMGTLESSFIMIVTIYMKEFFFFFLQHLYLARDLV